MVPWGYSVISSSWGGCLYLCLLCLPLTFLEWMGLIFMLLYLFIFTYGSSAAGFCRNVCLRSKETYRAWDGWVVRDSHKTQNEEFSLKRSLYLFLEWWFLKWAWSSLIGDVIFLGLGFPWTIPNSVSTISCTLSFCFHCLQPQEWRRTSLHHPEPQTVIP